MPRHPIEIREFRFYAREGAAQERPLRLEKKVCHVSHIALCPSTVTRVNRWTVGKSQCVVLRPTTSLTNEKKKKRNGDGRLTGVVTSAAKSSRRSAASFARKRAARARARGVVRSCWTGNSLRVSGVDSDAPHLIVDPETRTVGLGVARSDADINVGIVNSVEGPRGAKVMSDIIS
jgi:hypothetical protein